MMLDAETYDALLDAGREPPAPCPCTGHADEPPCGAPGCEELAEERQRAREAAAARRGDPLAQWMALLALRARYHEEEPAGGERESAVQLQLDALEETAIYRCSCGAEQLWTSMPCVGLQDTGRGDQVELRNCLHCFSTRARVA